MNNLIAYSLQLGALVALAALVPLALGIKVPAAKLAYWQVLLAACLALPLIRPWKEVTLRGVLTVSSTVTAINPSPHGVHWNISWQDCVFWLVVAGIGSRLAWLGAGFVKLRRLHLNSEPFEGNARISKDVPSPVTFGFLRPVILLPAQFPQLDPAAQRAILCHERIHVKRRDWVFTVAEELVRAALWFHPAIWWVLGEIQLAREQVVDRAVIGMTNARDQYVDALLAIAGAAQPDLMPAPSFLRRRHLKQRVSSIVKEIRMSKVRSLSALAAGLAMMAGLCWFVTGTFPLIAQTPADDPGVSVSAGNAQFIHRAKVTYPGSALTAHVEGTVVVQAALNPDGTVSGVDVLSGPNELRGAVMQSVRQWHFTHDSAAVQQIAVTFRIPGALTVGSISITGLSDQATSQLRGQLPVHEGEAVTPELLSRVRQAAVAFDEHLSVSAKPVSESKAELVVAPADFRIRVGGNVQSANLLSHGVPLYPPEAKAARVQGVVRMEVDVSPSGQVEDVRLVSGPPLLVQAAVDAVKQWTYRPTLLNGNPVAVMTTVDVNFTLAQ